MINVLIVDDSLTTQHIISSILTSDPEIRVIGVVHDGIEAMEFLRTNKPDVITMDLHMPRMSGVEVTRQIMQTKPVPIVIVSAFFEPENKELAFQLMEAGAVAAIDKPRGSEQQYSESANKLIQLVKNMSEVKLVTRRSSLSRSAEKKAEPSQQPRPSTTLTSLTPSTPVPSASAQISIIGIGASTGGPPVLRQILSELEVDFPVPIVVIQHIAAGFLDGLIDWLSKSTKLKVLTAQQGMVLEPGYIYFAPNDFQMTVSKDMRAVLSKSESEHGLRPSVSCLFRSLAENFGPAAVGILLTGMGTDGSPELKLMKNKGAITLAQDEQSSIVFGMPGEAIRIGGATCVLPPEKVAPTLVALLKSPPKLRRS